MRCHVRVKMRGADARSTIDAPARARQASSMIHLTLFDGAPIMVNPRHIFAIKSIDGGCSITAVGGGSISVKEAIDEVEAVLKRWTKYGDE
jgi:uncharacterized protein YlzI (FlbEa/FlbD family)